MIPDVLNTETVVFDTKEMKIQTPGKWQRWLEVEPGVDEIEREEPEQVFMNPLIRNAGDDPIRVYLREIGRVTLLTAQDEKTRHADWVGKRISGVRQELEKQENLPLPARFCWRLSGSWKFVEIIKNFRKILAWAVKVNFVRLLPMWI